VNFAWMEPQACAMYPLGGAIAGSCPLRRRAIRHNLHSQQSGRIEVYETVPSDGEHSRSCSSLLIESFASHCPSVNH